MSTAYHEAEANNTSWKKRMITIHKASFVSEPSQRRPRKQQQHRLSLPTCTKHIPAKCHTNELKKTGIANTKAPRMTGPYSINTIKSDQNVHLREQRSGSTCSVYMPNRSKPVMWTNDIYQKQSLKWPNNHRLVIEKGVKQALSNHFKKPRCRPLLVEGLSGGPACDPA